jgi:hypothetical protein
VNHLSQNVHTRLGSGRSASLVSSEPEAGNTLTPSLQEWWLQDVQQIDNARKTDSLLNGHDSFVANLAGKETGEHFESKHLPFLAVCDQIVVVHYLACGRV